MSSNYFKEHRIPTLEQLILLEQCKVGYKLCNRLLPKGLERLLSTDHKMKSTVKTHSYATRGKSILHRPSAKLSLYRNSFLYNSIKHYSSLPLDTRETNNLVLFITRCKKDLKIT